MADAGAASRPPAGAPATGASRVRVGGARRSYEDPAALRARIAARAATVAGEGLYEVLGVARGAGDAELRAAYFAAVKLYHPDRIAARGLGDAAEQAGAVFRRVCDAFAILSDSEQRAAYDARGAGEPGRGATAEAAVARRALEAELAFRRGEVFLRQRHYREALLELDRAAALEPDEGDYQGTCAWTRVLAGEATYLQALGALDRAATLAPRSARVHHYLGVARRESGDAPGALAAFTRAVELDPSHAEAASELRVLATRRAKETGKNRIIDRLRRR